MVIMVIVVIIFVDIENASILGIHLDFDKATIFLEHLELVYEMAVVFVEFYLDDFAGEDSPYLFLQCGKRHDFAALDRIPQTVEIVASI